METTKPDTPESPSAKPPAPARPTPPSPRPLKPPPRRGGGFFMGLLVLLALLAAGYSVWRVEENLRSRSSGQASAMAALEERLDTISRDDNLLRTDLDAMRARLRDADTVNKGLREEMLAIAERSRHLDDAIANLAEQRLTGRDALALNEAEFLLLMANERYQLFGDSAAAIAATRLADTALASTQDAVFASVRATIKAELDALAAAESSNTGATLAAIGALADKAAEWPMRTRQFEEDAEGSRFSRVFSRFIRIRHDGDTLAEREPVLARSLVAIDLHAAAGAWMARDDADYKASLQRARGELVGSFDDKSETIQAALAEIDRLSALTIAAPLPVLGTALKELRDLRTSRALSRQSLEAPVESIPQPADTESEPPLPAPEPLDQPMQGGQP